MNYVYIQRSLLGLVDKFIRERYQMFLDGIYARKMDYYPVKEQSVLKYGV